MGCRQPEVMFGEDQIMKRGIWIVAIGGLLGMPFLLAGCASTGADKEHPIAAKAAPDYHLGCQKCYDEVKRVRQASAKGKPWWNRNQVIKKHMCPECEVEMSTYTKDGQLMLKCGKCAPEGVACDRCLPPKAG